MSFDTIISGGTVIDGAGTPGVRADVGISGKEIAAIGDLSKAQAGRVIDATGLTITPGFIDVHAHSDGALLVDGQHANGIRQGVTTEILCPDGLSYAPLSRDDYLMYRKYLSGILGFPPEDLDMSSIDAFLGNYHLKTSCNVATFIGHGPVRISAVGMNDVPLRGNDMDRAKGMLREGLEQGARGFSTGLSYYPCAYSDTDELVELCSVAAEFGLPYSTHLRNHNTERGYSGGGVLEALEIGRRSGVPVHLEHYRTQPPNIGDIASIMDPVDAAKAGGVDVTLEAYVYPVGSSFPHTFVPGWFHEGGFDDMMDRLRDVETRKGLVKFLQETPITPMGGNMFTAIPEGPNSDLVGMTFEDAAAARDTSIEELVVQLMADENMAVGFRGIPPTSVRVWRAFEEDVMNLLSRPDYMIGSDSIPVAPPLVGLVHPRAYGCFARFIGRLRRRFNRPLEQVIQRITQNPAQRFKIDKRGLLTKGNFADIVVFNADTVNDQSSFEDPAVHPSGIPYVFVNGKLAVENEQVTGVLAGEAVR
ncbi:MAG: amidohydrolase family protein [Chloroflexi bacterium]|nr:amidohydrolase family protein [Chloroflexota bacterium]